MMTWREDNIALRISCGRALALDLKFGRRPIDEDSIEYAAKLGNLEAMEFILRADKPPINTDVIAYASERGHLMVVKLLLESGKAPVDTRAIRLAIRNNDIKLVKLLLKFDKVPVDQRCTLSAATKGYTEIFKLLLESDKAPLDGNAIYRAALNGHALIVKRIADYYFENDCISMLNWFKRDSKKIIKFLDKSLACARLQAKLLFVAKNRKEIICNDNIGNVLDFILSKREKKDVDCLSSVERPKIKLI